MTKPKPTRSPDPARPAGAATISLPLLDTPSPARAKKLGKSKRSVWRAAVLIAVHAIIIAHLVQWLITGTTVSPVEPSEAMETLELGTLNAGFIFFAIAILSTLIFGRFFCGWGCHVVALQDLCAWMLKKVGIRPKPFRSRLLAFVPLALAIYMFAWPSLKRLIVFPAVNAVDPAAPVLGPPAHWLANFLRPPAQWPVDGLQTGILVEDFWSTFPGPLVAIPFLFICGFAAVYFLGAKGFCTYGCPYGGVFGPVDRISPGRIVVDHDKCDSNAHCTATCSSNVRVHEEIATHGMVVDPGCMKCTDCISVCPSNALAFRFATPPAFARLAKSKRREGAPQRIRNRADTTWLEDISLALVFFLTFISLRGMYDLVPLLMAVGIAGIITFIAWKLWQTIKLPNARFRKWQFKRNARLTRAGIALILTSALLTIFIAHAGVMNYHAAAGARIHDRFPFNPARLFTPNPPTIDDDLRQRARQAIDHLQKLAPLDAGGIALAPNPRTDLMLASMHRVIDDNDAAITALRRVVHRLPSNEGVILRLGNTLLDQGRTEDAESLYTNALANHPHFADLAQDLVGLLLQNNRPDELVPILAAAINQLPSKRRYNDERSRLHELVGHTAFRLANPQAALAAYRAAVETDPSRADAHDTLAGALLNIERDPDAALAALRAAAAADPASPDRWLKLMQATASIRGIPQAQSLADPAIAALTRARDDRPRRHERWMNLARMQATLARPDDAIATINNALAADLPRPIPNEQLRAFANQLNRPDLINTWVKPD